MHPLGALIIGIAFTWAWLLIPAWRKSNLRASGGVESSCPEARHGLRDPMDDNPQQCGARKLPPAGVAPGPLARLNPKIVS